MEDGRYTIISYIVVGMLNKYLVPVIKQHGLFVFDHATVKREDDEKPALLSNASNRTHVNSRVVAYYIRSVDTRLSVKVAVLFSIFNCFITLYNIH